MKQLIGKVALVTGGAQGLGHAAALRLARDGARVAVVDKDLAAGAATVKAIEAAGGVACFIAATVGAAGEAARAVDATIAAFGQLDVLWSTQPKHGPPGNRWPKRRMAILKRRTRPACWVRSAP